MASDVIRGVGSVFCAAAVVIGHFTPLWLVIVLAVGWLFNAAVYFRRGVKGMMRATTEPVTGEEES